MLTIGTLMLNLTVQRFFIWHQIIGIVLQQILLLNPGSQPIMNRNTFLLVPISADRPKAPIIMALSLG
jgi:hypothetical protein